MANLTTTNVLAAHSVLLQDGVFEDGVITFGGADTLAAGTILARHSSTLKYQIYAKGGSTNGNGVPVAVLLNEVVATGSGDIPVKVAIGGKFRKDRLIIDADADDSNIDAAVRDLLRQLGMFVIDVTELNIQDNQ